MGAPYSQDLRLRVLAAIDGGLSKMAAHKTFGISRSTLDDWLRLREQTGSVQANTSYHRGRAPSLPDTPAAHAFMQHHQHSTLEQMALAWEKESKQRLSGMTFSTTLRRLGYTRKKRAISTKSDALPSETPLHSRSLPLPRQIAFMWMKLVSRTHWTTPMVGVSKAPAVWVNAWGTARSVSPWQQLGVRGRF